MVTRKSAVMPSSERAAIEADFWAEVKETSQTISSAKHGQPDVEYSLTSMVGKIRQSDGELTVKLYERRAFGQTEESVVTDAIRRAFGDRHGKLTADECRYWSGLLAWQGNQEVVLAEKGMDWDNRLESGYWDAVTESVGQGYAAQAAPFKAVEVEQQTAADLKAQEETQRAHEELKARWVSVRADGDNLLMDCVRAEARLIGLKLV